jgi:hypothetical protein
LEVTLRSLRSFLADLLGLRDERARNGAWWELDFILVLLTGSLLAAGIALASI